MKHLLPTLVFGALLFGGTVPAQSFEPPAIPDLSGIDAAIAEAQEAIASGISEALAQSFEPPAIPDLSGLDAAIAEAQEAIASGISEALVTTAAGIIETLPDPINPDLGVGGAIDLSGSQAEAAINRAAGLFLVPPGVTGTLGGISVNAEEIVFENTVNIGEIGLSILNAVAASPR